MHVHGLDGAIHLLLLRGQAVEVELRGRRQRLDHVFQRVAEGAVQQVEGQHGDFRVGQELRNDVVLAQVFGDAEVVGEVAVVDQGLVHADEGVRAGGVPDAALGRIALMGDPDVSREVVHPIVLHHLFGIADDLEDQQVSGVREDERLLLAQGRVEALVQLEAVLVDELVLQRAGRQTLQVVGFGESLAGMRVSRARNSA